MYQLQSEEYTVIGLTVHEMQIIIVYVMYLKINKLILW